MPSRSSLKKHILFITAAMTLLATAAYLFLPILLDLDTYKDEILAELQNALKRQVSYSTGKFTISFGPAITLNNVVIKEPDGSATFIAMEQLTCRIALIPLLKKHVVVTGLDADRPTARIERWPDGRFNFSDLLDQKDSTAPPLSINHLSIKDGTVIFTDRKISTTGLVTRLASTNLYLSSLSRGEKCELKLSGEFVEGGSGKFTIHGKARVAPKNRPLSETDLDLKIVTKQLDVSQFWPYYGSYVPFKKVLGRIEANTTFKGRLREFTSTGRLSFSGLRFDYQPVFKGPLTPAALQLKYSLELSERDILVKAVELALDGVDIKGSCAIRDINTKDPRITAQAITSNFNFEKCNKYIPYGIIVKDTAEWIEQHITGGIFRLDDGRLDGRVSQILHMEKNENYNVLYIKGHVEKGLVSYGSSVPTFNNIKGILEMKGKDFLLHQMSGSFGTAPFTLEGRITDYPIDKPSGYPFRMTISPGQSELAWLLGKSRGGRIFYNGNASLSLSGEGFTSGYQLSGNWNLTPAVYSYTNMVSKPVGVPSGLSFRMLLSPKEVSVPSLQYTLGQMALNISAKYPFATDGKLDMAINSNLFNIGDVAGMIPPANKYHPSGKIQLALRGESSAAGSNDFRWRGTLSMNNASIRPSEESAPVSAINGSITFDDASMESSHLTARIGNTSFNGKGSIASVTPLTFNSSFSAASVDLADFGFTRTSQLQISRVRGDVSFKDNSLQIKSLSGQVNASQLSLKGSINDLDNPKVDLSIHSPFINITDILAFTELERKAGKDKKESPALNLKASIKADSGTFRDIRFDKLNSLVQVVNRIVYLQPVEASVYGGRLTAKGRIDTLSSPTRYQVDGKLAGASASQLMSQLSMDKREMTGTVTVEGELTARGENANELKKSALGSVRIAARNGSLRQFPMLSKVFSILNVSQLFRLKLPDMVSEGMPYNDIKATLSFKDGTLATKDLFVASNAMNMSFIGSYDYIHDNMDFTLGIQPLQTVDKVVSHIPIVGWILTGKDKTLLTTYFEIKGKTNNPQVSAIPVKYLGRGVLDIFKRVFQLPAKLITDTGEVILGN